MYAILPAQSPSPSSSRPVELLSAIVIPRPLMSLLLIASSEGRRLAIHHSSPSIEIENSVLRPLLHLFDFLVYPFGDLIDEEARGLSALQLPAFDR